MRPTMPSVQVVLAGTTATTLLHKFAQALAGSRQLLKGPTAAGNLRCDVARRARLRIGEKIAIEALETGKAEWKPLPRGQR